MTTARRTLARGVTLGAGLAVASVTRQTLNRLSEESLRGEVALITGGSRGLGLALARELAEEGCRLAICARDGEELERARKDLVQRGAEVLTVVCDVRDEAQVGKMVTEVTNRFGRIDLLINNAGIITVGPVQAMTSEEFARAMETDFWGVVYPTLAVLPQMRDRRRGRVVTITSVGGKISMPHLLPYNSAKFAAVGFSEGLRAELAPDGIIVTTVVPGEMKTGSHLHAEFAGEREKEYRWFALGASSPLTISADRAARTIVRGIKRGTAELTFPISAKIGTRLNGLFPGAAASALTAIERLLPAAGDGKQGTVPGVTVAAGMNAPVLEKATALGRSAAERFNQYPDGQAETAPGAGV
jgi:NAD(P)-dependent dehydrogenase (short-subunit alcohol dehydrogenase family)